MGTFVMPSLGADMAAGTLVEWLKQPGDTVEHGDIIAVVETDKGAIEVEVFEKGRIDELLVEAGSAVPVGTPLARIDGEANGVKPSATGPAKPKVGTEPVRATPPRPSALLVMKGQGPRASPAARQHAAERGIDLASLAGSGPDGAIQLVDVERAECIRSEPGLGSGPDLSAMRRAIAAAMARSKREIPHYYLSHRFDLSAALEWLERYNAERPPPERLLLGALQIKAVASALKEFPEFNGFYGEEGFSPFPAVHLGTAIAIRGGGLAAPCIRHTDTLTLSDLMESLRDLVARTRRGQFRSSEIADATATVSNLGERGVESLWPVIYPPQVAIVGFGSVMWRPWAVKDEPVVRPVITTTLAGDHRANNGHRGALLLRRIEQILSEPDKL
ncbi:pyruvate dehydrogenase complex dihydrolipoamide acetyltransferase [Pontixanthobacter gangjinensis]|uniref:Dihydrolipoamide acetyltransferase component of pyruvate dehydrogenase complex n=1 Tax=Pontixanthobacter gangjinensis TaxID=1028742 RepID=A0A6I4SQZ8_9SPHN|nr:dihydrolipoamide acetyltransferase family protein [Pontixanthobacter gangjinensis]MXO57287.1 2-oxo acid dehydrogenase subunit E2 [Pontixanthobacter gangjinensis]